MIAMKVSPAHFEMQINQEGEHETKYGIQLDVVKEKVARGHQVGHKYKANSVHLG